MRAIGYYNGIIGDLDSMTVPMNDRGMYFGDGVYDATYAANRVIFEADAHIERFYNSARALRMPFDMTREALRGELMRCVEACGSDGEVMVYWQITRGTGARKHDFPVDGKQANLLITVRDVKLVDLRKKIDLITVEDTRHQHCNIKTLNLIPNVMAAQQARESGCAEVVFHRGDRVTECAHSNIHILRNGVFQTAPTDHLILPGITRKHLLRICEEEGIPCREEPFTLAELFDADEVIVSSAGTLGIGVKTIDGRPVGGKAPELLRTLQLAAVRDFERETGHRPDII